MTRRSLLTTAGTAIAGMWLAEKQIDAGPSNMWWPYDIHRVVEAGAGTTTAAPGSAITRVIRDTSRT